MRRRGLEGAPREREVDGTGENRESGDEEIVTAIRSNNVQRSRAAKKKVSAVEAESSLQLTTATTIPAVTTTLPQTTNPR